MNVSDLNQRSLDIFRELVDAFVETGEAVGSRTLSRRLTNKLSSATIRNVMADLEDAGLLYAPHTSAGRIPTEDGLRFFVNGLLEIGHLSKDEQEILAKKFEDESANLPKLLEEASSMLSGLTNCASLVLAPKYDSTLKHIEFVGLGNSRALVVLITEEGMVENRIVQLPAGITASTLIEATNYLSSKLAGKTLAEARDEIILELSKDKADLDALTAKVVEDGLAVWAGGQEGGSLIVKGQAHLLEGLSSQTELEQIKSLFEKLETKENLVNLLDESINADGVQIFIGSENQMFGSSGCSAIVAPYHNSTQKLIGAIGIVGPARMNYGKIIPLVDYTAKLISKIIG